MAGALKTLYGQLKTSPYLTGVSFVYGEEEIHDQAQPLPMVAMVPRGGPFIDDPGYSKDLDPYVARQWAVNEAVDLVLWAADVNPLAVPIDHADAIESLRVRVLSALQLQREQGTAEGVVERGLWFKAMMQRWETMQGAFSRLGRALVITVTAEIPIPMAPPPEATVTSYQLEKQISVGA